MLKKIIFSVIAVSIFNFGFAQTGIPGFKSVKKEWNDKTYPVYEFKVPKQEDLGKAFSKFLKDIAGEKLSEKKGQWTTDLFEIPGSVRSGVVRAWVVPTDDSLKLQTCLDLGNDIFSNQVSFETEDKFILSTLKKFHFANLKEYYENRLDDIRDRQKDLKKSIKKLENTLSDNAKEAKQAEKEAKKDPGSKNELLGRAKDLRAQNESLKVELSEKKDQAVLLSKEEKQYGQLLSKHIETFAEKQ